MRLISKPYGAQIQPDIVGHVSKLMDRELKMYIVGKLLRKLTLKKDNRHWSEKREREDFNLKVKYLLKWKRRTDVRFYSSCLHIIVAYFHYTVMLPYLLAKKIPW